LARSEGRDRGMVVVAGGGAIPAVSWCRGRVSSARLREWKLVSVPWRTASVNAGVGMRAALPVLASVVRSAFSGCFLALSCRAGLPVQTRTKIFSTVKPGWVLSGP
jgi:hypothetical protein